MSRTKVCMFRMLHTFYKSCDMPHSRPGRDNCKECFDSVVDICFQAFSIKNETWRHDSHGWGTYRIIELFFRIPVIRGVFGPGQDTHKWGIFFLHPGSEPESESLWADELWCLGGKGREKHAPFQTHCSDSALISDLKGTVILLHIMLCSLLFTSVKHLMHYISFVIIMYFI